MHSPMTRRSTVFVNRPAFQLSRSRCLHASTMSPCGCGATVYSSALLKQKSSGAQQVGNSIRFPRFQRVLARTSLPCHLRTGPGYLSRCRRHYEDPRFEDSVVLFCCTSADPQHAQLHSIAGISGHVAGSVPAWLCQRHSWWSSGKLYWSAAVHAERHCMIGLLRAEVQVQPCDAAPWAALAEDETVDWVQDGSSCLPLSQWPGAVVPCQRSPARDRPRLSASPAFTLLHCSNVLSVTLFLFCKVSQQSFLTLHHLNQFVEWINK